MGKLCVLESPWFFFSVQRGMNPVIIIIIIITKGNNIAYCQWSCHTTGKNWWTRHNITVQKTVPANTTTNVSNMSITTCAFISMQLPFPSLSLYTILNISCEKWQNDCKIWIPFKCTVKTKEKTSKASRLWETWVCYTLILYMKQLTNTFQSWNRTKIPYNNLMCTAKQYFSTLTKYIKDYITHNTVYY